MSVISTRTALAEVEASFVLSINDFNRPETCAAAATRPSIEAEIDRGSMMVAASEWLESSREYRDLAVKLSHLEGDARQQVRYRNEVHHTA